MTAEEWRPVVGYEGRYDVSNHGRVRSLLHNRGARLKVPRVLKPRLHDRGYHRVNLCKDGRPTDAYIHIVVMAAFVGPCPEGMEVNHDDGVKSNNILSNLEYATPLQNIQHSVRLGLWKPELCSAPGSQNGTAKLCEAVIPAVRAAAAISLDDAAVRFGISRTQAHKILRRKAWKHVA
jgi:NUMOD4 motif/HNH endonuclease